MGVIFPLDDFTIDNGATYYLKGSIAQKKYQTEIISLKTQQEAFAKKVTDFLMLELMLASI